MNVYTPSFKGLLDLFSYIRQSCIPYMGVDDVEKSLVSNNGNCEEI